MATAVNEHVCRGLGFDIVRRVTGGRAVLHKAELTYSVAARTDNTLFPPTVLGTYKVIATALVAGLRNLGIAAEMVSRGTPHAALVQKKPKQAACFSSPSWYEIVVNGKKIIGSAQRRSGTAFLQHGSILIGYDPELEARVIPGGSSAGSVTSINEVLGCECSAERIGAAITNGFMTALGIRFER